VWFIVKVFKDSDSIQVAKGFDSFNECWTDYTRYLSAPYDKESYYLEVCSADREEEALEKIKSLTQKVTAFGEVSSASIDSVVKDWAKAYGEDLSKAAELTTPNLRGGRPKDKWMEDTQKTLKEIDYKFLKGNVIKQIVRPGEWARVDFRKNISTKDGNTNIDETYLLKYVDGNWLIDEVKNADEESKEGT